MKFANCVSLILATTFGLTSCSEQERVNSREESATGEHFSSEDISGFSVNNSGSSQKRGNTRVRISFGDNERVKGVTCYKWIGNIGSDGFIKLEDTFGLEKGDKISQASGNQNQSNQGQSENQIVEGGGIGAGSISIDNETKTARDHLTVSVDEGKHIILSVEAYKCDGGHLGDPENWRNETLFEVKPKNSIQYLFRDGSAYMLVWVL